MFSAGVYARQKWKRPHDINNKYFTDESERYLLSDVEVNGTLKCQEKLTR